MPCEDSEILQSHDNSDYVSLKLHIHLQVKPSLIAWLIKTIITLIVFISQGHLLSSFVSLAHALLTQARKLTPLAVKSTGAAVDFILELATEVAPSRLKNIFKTKEPSLSTALYKWRE